MHLTKPIALAYQETHLKQIISGFLKQSYNKNYCITNASLGTDNLCYEELYTVVTGIVLFHHIIKEVVHDCFI